MAVEVGTFEVGAVEVGTFEMGRLRRARLRMGAREVAAFVLQNRPKLVLILKVVVIPWQRVFVSYAL